MSNTAHRWRRHRSEPGRCRRGRIGSRSLAVIAAAAVLGACSDNGGSEPPPPPPPPQPPQVVPGEFTAAIAEISSARTTAEEMVSLLKGKQDDISEQDFDDARALYIDARSAAESWISLAQAELISSESVTPTVSYQDATSDLAAKAQAFVNYVKNIQHKPIPQEPMCQDEIVNGEPVRVCKVQQDISLGPIVGAAVTALPDIARVGLDIWREYNRASEAESAADAALRQEMLDLLDAERWPSFATIP